jgi:hypothetical protein
MPSGISIVRRLKSPPRYQALRRALRSSLGISEEPRAREVMKITKPARK